MPEAHPLAMIFPLADGQPLDDLAKDISAHGQQEPIVLLDGKILDGRRRWRVCQIAQVDVKVVQFEDVANGMTPAEFVWSKNFHRRHLTESERSMAVAKMEEYTHGGDRKDQDANLHLDRKTLADEANVSVRLVASASKVLRKADPDVVTAVENGVVSVSDAASVADLPPEVQKAAVQAKMNGETKTLREGTGNTISRYQKPPKPGKAISPKDFDKHIGALIRFFDDVHASEGKIHKVAHARILKWADDGIHLWKQWQKLS